VFAAIDLVMGIGSIAKGISVRQAWLQTVLRQKEGSKVVPLLTFNDGGIGWCSYIIIALGSGG